MKKIEMEVNSLNEPINLTYTYTLLEDFLKHVADENKENLTFGEHLKNFEKSKEKIEFNEVSKADALNYHNLSEYLRYALVDNKNIPEIKTLALKLFKLLQKYTHEELLILDDYMRKYEKNFFTFSQEYPKLHGEYILDFLIYSKNNKPLISNNVDYSKKGFPGIDRVYSYLTDGNKRHTDTLNNAFESTFNKFFIYCYLAQVKLKIDGALFSNMVEHLQEYLNSIPTDLLYTHKYTYIILNYTIYLCDCALASFEGGEPLSWIVELRRHLLEEYGVPLARG